MRILAIDPGHTTGWCKIEVEDEKPKYVFSGNIDYKETNIIHAFRHLIKEDLTDIVIERLPYRLSPILSAVYSNIRVAINSNDNEFRPIEVAPAEWKPITGKYPLPKLDWRTTQHERDAWRMGVFWLWREGLIKIL